MAGSNGQQVRVQMAEIPVRGLAGLAARAFGPTAPLVRMLAQRDLPLNLVARVKVYGNNQDGQWRVWEFESRCSSGSASPFDGACPSSVTTEGWRWVGAVIVDIDYVVGLASGDSRSWAHCEVTVPRVDRGGDVVTVYGNLC